MHRIRSFWIRFLNLFRRSTLETDLREQLEAHREMIRADLIHRGMDPTEALVKARQAVGNDAMIRELSRDEMVHRLVYESLRDLRHGFRTLRKNPAFAVTACLSLAIGIGANTFIFSLINSTLLHSLGYPNPERLAVIWTTELANLAQTSTSSVTTYFALRDSSRSIDDIGAFN